MAVSKGVAEIVLVRERDLDRVNVGVFVEVLVGVVVRVMVQE